MVKKQSILDRLLNTTVEVAGEVVRLQVPEYEKLLEIQEHGKLGADAKNVQEWWAVLVGKCLAASVVGNTDSENSWRRFALVTTSAGADDANQLIATAMKLCGFSGKQDDGGADPVADAAEKLGQDPS